MASPKQTADPTRQRSERLRDISAKLPSNSVPASRGSGFRAWDTRRANIFSRACSDLQRAIACVEDLRSAARVISDHIAERAPAVETLPRGYSITFNAGGDASLARGLILFGPWYSDAEPDIVALALLGRDLKTGLLAEIETQIGAKLR